MSNIASPTGIRVPAIAVGQPVSRTYDLAYDPVVRLTVSVAYGTDLPQEVVDEQITFADLKAALVARLNEMAVEVRSERRKERLAKIATAISEMAPLPWLSNLPPALVIRGQCTQETMYFDLASEAPPYAFQGTGSEACDTRAFTAETRLIVENVPVSFCTGELAGAEPPDPDTHTPGSLAIRAELTSEGDSADEADDVTVSVALHTTFTASVPAPEADA